MASEEGIAHVGSGDFLRDEGVEDPDEMRLRIRLQYEIETIAERRGLSPDELAGLTGLPKDEVGGILRGGVSTGAVWPLMRAVAALGCNILIDVGEPTDGDGSIYTTWPETDAAT